MENAAQQAPLGMERWKTRLYRNCAPHPNSLYAGLGLSRSHHWFPAQILKCILSCSRTPPETEQCPLSRLMVKSFCVSYHHHHAARAHTAAMCVFEDAEKRSKAMKDKETKKTTKDKM
eukprot:gene16837-biopygen20321